MKHVYKLGGEWEREGICYTVKAVNSVREYLMNGWVLSFEDLEKPEPKPKRTRKKKGAKNGDN